MTRMERRRFVVGTLSLLAAPLAVEAQQALKVPRIGFLGSNTARAAPDAVAAFRQALRERHWIEGQNIVVDFRFADGHVDRLPVLVAELIQLKVDIIVAGSSASTRAAKNATTSIPTMRLDLWAITLLA